MSELGDAVDAADWPRALELSLAAWRTTHAVELAALIDAIDLRLPREQPPRLRSQIPSWWRELAMTFEATTLPTLLAASAIGHGGAASWTELRARWKSLGFAALAVLEKDYKGWGVYDRLEGANWVERVIALASWPDDPRLAQIFIAWLERPPITLAAPALAAIAELFADRLVAIADTRAVPRLERCIAEPRGALEATREHQVQAALRVVAAIRARRDTPLEPTLAAEVARCLARLPHDEPDTAKADADIAALWQAVATNRDDLATRLVLADALVARGDPRGDFIALQCSDVSRNADRARTLLRRHWSEWLGDLALLVSRKSTVFEHGMLRTTRIGTATTPPWVWGKVRDHRELQTVVDLRPDIVPPDDYAELCAALPHLETLGIDAPETIQHLAAIGARLPVTVVGYSEHNATLPSIRDLPALLGVCRDLATCAPKLAELDLIYLHGSTQSELDRVLPELPGLFPALRKLRIASFNFHEQPAVRARAQAMPLVEIY